MMTPIEALDYLGVALFAATGAFAASRKQLDFIGFIFLGAATGIGGGTARDLILDVPVFWIVEPTYLLICACTSIGIYFTAPFVESRYKVLLWLDALAMASYSVYGAYKGLSLTGSAAVAIVMGMFTAALGGIIRDIIAREPSVLLRREIYIAACAVGAAIYVVAEGLEYSTWISATAGFVFSFIIRGGTIKYGWRLPAYRSAPGRDPKDL